MKIMKRIRKYYDNLKIQTKLSICILLAAIAPFLFVGIAFFGQLYDMIGADTIRNEQEAAMQMVPKIEAVLSEITYTYDHIADTDYYKSLFQTSLSASPETLADSPEALSFAETVREFASKDPICAIRIYMDFPADDPFFQAESSRELFLPLSLVKGTYWYGIFQGGKDHSLYCPPFYLGSREKESYGDCAYITETFLHYEGQNFPCYIAVYYSSAPFKQLLSDGISFPGSVSYIINEREALLASTDEYLAGIYHISYADISKSLMSSNNFITRDILGETVYVSFNYIEEPGWLMVTITPSKPLIHKSNIIILKFSLFCVLCVICAFLLAVWQSRSITTRISSVIRQMTKIRSGTPVSMPSPIIQDEVGELISTYNYMTERMNQLMDSQRKTAEELRIAEFNSLQAQINPHFLYNTMDMINWMAQKGCTDEISNAVQQLSRFYKLTLSHRSNFMSIEEELEHVSIYVELQNMRYQNAFNFVIDIPDELLCYNIPKLTLQPIVENAILHGILEKEEKTGTIVITGWREKDSIILLVSDDGAGIPPEKLPHVLSGRSLGRTTGTNIAVFNIHRRLQLLYGETYGLTYSSTQGQGTEVKLLLPAAASG